MANYQIGNNWTPDIETDAATLASGTQGGAGSGGTITNISGGGPTGGDCWEFSLTAGGTDQKNITFTPFGVTVQQTVGLWINFLDYTNIKKVYVFLGNDNFTNYYRVTITANDIEGDQGWIFISRPLSQFSTTGSPDWANPITHIRIGCTGEAGAAAGAKVRVGPLYTNIQTRPKVLLFLDDANETDYTVAYPYLSGKGLKANCGIIESKIDTAGFLASSELSTMYAAGWDICCHDLTELDTLTLAQQTAQMVAAKAYIESLGFSRSSSLYVTPGGKFDTNTIAAAQAAGITSMRHTIQYPMSPAISPNLFDMRAVATSQTSGTTSTNWIAEVDDAIDNRSTIGFFSHRLDDPATGIHTDTSEWKLLVDAIETRVNSGLIDLVTWSEYVNGLADTVWTAPGGFMYFR